MTQTLRLIANWHHEVPLKIFTFAGGEIQVRVENPRVPVDDLRIVAHLRSSADVMALLLLTDAVRRHFGDVRLSLVCPYLPYARQDRVCYEGEALSLRVMCNLINAQGYASVRVWDVHSDVALALLNNVCHLPASDFIWNVDPQTMLVAPDAGAAKRVAAVAKRTGCSYIQAEKVRDTNTGAILATHVNCDPATIEHRDFLIVDDICDGGRTFVELAKVLRPLTDGAVNLYVTHGIFSAGFDVFAGLIDNIYVANSFVDDLPPFVHRCKITSL